MSRPRKWTLSELPLAVATSTSYRQVLLKIGLVPAGGNFVQIKRYIETQGLSTAHFTGKSWNKGRTNSAVNRKSLEILLTENSGAQSHKLKLRLFRAGLKKAQCKLCGWARLTVDGRIPVELDHINGRRWDNRIENLRILCPNCHSLQVTHRGKNKNANLTN